MSVDSIGDFLTIIRNGLMVGKPSVTAFYSGIRHQIATLLKERGFVSDVVVNEERGKKNLIVTLKYSNGESVIHEISRVSTPGSRYYAGVKKINPVIGGLGLTILSTSRGILTSDQAKIQNVGGEVICTVW